jgi:hypothetical protein
VVQRGIDQGTPIDSELLIYCLQADYILNRIRVCIAKSPSSTRLAPLLLSTMDVTSPSSVALLYTVVMTAYLSVALLHSVVVTLQSLDALLWSVVMSPQLIINQLSCSPHGVDQLSSEFGSSHSELCLLLTFSLPAPSVSVPVLMTHCSIVLVMSHSGACSAPV